MQCFPFIVVIAVLALPALRSVVSAAPAEPDEEAAHAHIDKVMSTQSPAEAIQDAIRYNPNVADALRDNNTDLYLLKTITYTSGTAEDLDLPKEQLLPEGAPDRIRVADKIVYPSPLNSTVTAQDESNMAINSNKSNVEVHATLQLLPVPIN